MLFQDNHLSGVHLIIIIISRWQHRLDTKKRFPDRWFKLIYYWYEEAWYKGSNITCSRRHSEISSGNYNTIILSHERSCVKLPPEGIERVKRMLEQFNHTVRIIIYLRRQDLKLASALSTRVKNGSTAPLRATPSDRMAESLSYDKILKNYDHFWQREG